MSFVASATNYANATLRASGVTSGASEQDTAVTLPDTVNELWVVVTKTAEFNIDNLLTVRLQCQVNSVWFDVSWNSITTTQVLTTAADLTADVTRKTNIVDVDSTTPTYTIIAHYEALPSNVVRIASVSSGTGVINTFGVESFYQQNNL